MTESKSDIDIREVTDWFTTLYRDARGYLHIASAGNWAGQFFDLNAGMAAAAQHVEALNHTDTSGIYARVTTLIHPPPAGSGKRGGADLSASLPALWADLDIAGPNHRHVACPGGDDCQHLNSDGLRQHANPVLPLPPTDAAAYAIIDGTELPPPTLWIHSGGGLYPIWLIDPVHQVTNDMDEVGALSVGWQRVIAAAAHEAGWAYGTGVGDLARVLRIPGTWNRKTADPQPCRVVEHLGHPYALADLRNALVRAVAQFPVAAQTPVAREPPPQRRAGDVRPGDDFAARVDWADSLLLGRLGWQVIRQQGRYREWLRPGATSALTATSGREGLDNLYVFSTSTVFPVGEAISKLEAFRLITGEATLTDAARTLNAMGFGTPPGFQVPTPNSPSEHLWPPGSSATRPTGPSPNGAHAAVQPAAEGTELWVEPPPEAQGRLRRIVTTPASAYRPRRVRWGWRDGEYGRCPVGEITLVPGREGVGKSLFLAWLIANLTRGTLPGEYMDTPHPVLYSTAEDSWEHTVAPRLIAAGADLDLVHRVEVVEEEIGRTKLVLPKDCRGLVGVARDMGAAALMLDPIISLIDDELSVNQSRELRLALEPLRDAAERARMMVVALAHFNKMADVDVLSKISGARAWGEVVRAAIALAENSDTDGDATETTYVASQVKNNLGRRDLPHLTYQIERVWVDTDEGPATADTGKLVWTGTSSTGVDEILDRKRSRRDTGTAAEVADFVVARYTETGHPVAVTDVMTAMPQLSKGAIQQALTRAVNRYGTLAKAFHGHYIPPPEAG